MQEFRHEIEKYQIDNNCIIIRIIGDKKEIESIIRLVGIRIIVRGIIGVRKW